MANKVLDFVKKRQESIETKRRNFKRLMFDNILGAYTVIKDQDSIYPISLIDISLTGCLFQIPWIPKSKKPFKKGDELRFRMYFTQKEFIPIIVKLKYARKFTETTGESFLRCGGEFDTDAASFEALESFIKFLYQFAEHCAEDHGDSKVYFL